MLAKTGWEPRSQIVPRLQKMVCCSCGLLAAFYHLMPAKEGLYGGIINLKVIGNGLSAAGSVPVVNFLMDPVQVPYPLLEVQRHQQHGRTPLEEEA